MIRPEASRRLWTALPRFARSSSCCLLLWMVHRFLRYERIYGIDSWSLGRKEMQLTAAPRADSADVIARVASAYRRRLGRRWWFDAHSWRGVMLGLPLFVICWSGAFATCAHEIDWLVNPILRVEPQLGELDLAEIHRRVKGRFPSSTIVSVSRGPSPRFAVDAIVRGPDAQTRHVYVDPYSDL